MGNIDLMKPKKRQKLCHNCEGEIDVDVIVCPFCAADLREEKPEQRYCSHPQSFSNNQMTQSLYPSSIQDQEVQKPSEIPSRISHQEEAFQDVPSEENKQAGLFVPTVLFTLGVQLFIFGLLMLLFSHKGTVILKWDARFWFVYLFVAVPFLIFGYRALSKL